MWWIPQESQSERLPGWWKYFSDFFSTIFFSSQNVGDSALCTFSQTCCNIETLDLSSCKKLSDKTFHCLAQHCTKLATLNISSCSSLTDTSLRAIGHGCPQLISLNLSWCELITQAGIALIAQGCRKLKTFISKVGLLAVRGSQ